MKRFVPILLALPFLALFAWITFRDSAPELSVGFAPRPARSREEVRRPLPSLPDDPRTGDAPQPVPKETATSEPRVAILFGVVTGPDGEPVEGALVYLTAPAAVARMDGPRSATDAEGRFLLTITPGDYDIIAWKSGLLPAVLTDVSSAAGDRRDLGVLELLPGLAIAGRVVDTDGRGIVGASVAGRCTDLHLPDGALPGRVAAGRFAAAASDADGNFRLNGLVPGTLMVFADALAYEMTGEPREVPAGETGVVIELRRLLLLTGRILSDLDGKAISSATVTLEVRTARFTEILFFKDLVSGRFSFDLTGKDLEGEEVELTLMVTALGHAEQSARGLSLEDLRPEKKYVLRLIETVPEEPGTLIGRVLYDTGAPFLGTLTISLPRPGRAAEIFRVRTDKEGRFTLPGVPPGEYPLYTAPHRTEILLDTGNVLLIPSGGEVRTEFTIIRGGDVEISVTGDRGEQIDGAEVSLLDESGEAVMMQPMVDGKTTFLDLAPGEFRFQVSAPGHQAVTLTTRIEKDTTASLHARLPETR